MSKVEEEPTKKLTSTMKMVVAMWMLAGLAAFLMSIYCIDHHGGTTQEKAVGFGIALLFGPFYWIYYIATGYCNRHRNK